MKWSPTEEVLDLLNKFSLSEPQKCLEESVENMSPYERLLRKLYTSQETSKKSRKNRKEDSIAIFFLEKYREHNLKKGIIYW